MVFLIQSSQNRETQALQIKLDEVIRALHGAHNALMDLEEFDQKELELIRSKYGEIAHQARKDLKRGEGDTSAVDVQPHDPNDTKR